MTAVGGKTAPANANDEIPVGTHAGDPVGDDHTIITDAGTPLSFGTTGWPAYVATTTHVSGSPGDALAVSVVDVDDTKLTRKKHPAGSAADVTNDTLVVVRNRYPAVYG